MNTIHTICIVDDDEEIRSLLSDYLRRNGFSTCTAGVRSHDKREFPAQ